MNKALRKSLLFLTTVTFIIALVLSFSFVTKTSLAQSSEEKTYYLTDVNQIKTLREHQDGKIFYHDTNGNGRFDLSFDVHVFRSETAPRLVPQASQDVAFVWTAPKSGVVYSALSSQDIVITDNKSSGFKVAQAKVFENTIDANYLDSNGELTFYSNTPDTNLNIADVIKTNTATSQGDSATRNRIEMGFGTSANPITVRQGEKLMVVVRKGDDTNTNADGAELGRWKINFKADGETSYTSTNLCANLSGLTDENFLSTVNGLNFDFVSVGQKIACFYSETDSSNLLDYELGFKRYKEMSLIPPKNSSTTPTGLWNASGDINSNWEIVTNGDTAKAVRISSSTSFDRAISFKSPADGIVQVDKLGLVNSSFGSRQAPVNYAVLLRKAGDDGDTYKYLYKPEETANYQGKNYCLAASGTKTLENGEIPTVTVSQGDEVMFVILGGSNTFSNSHVAIDIQISFKSDSDVSVYTLNSNTPKITTQGVNNFYFVYFELYTPMAEFNEVKDKSELPVAFDGATIGLSELVFKNNLWYIDESSVNYSVAVNGSVCKIAPQPQDGAVVWVAPEDCKAWVNELYLSTGYSANNFVENHTVFGNGIKYALLYVDNSGDVPKYYNLLNQDDWTLLEYALNADEVAEKELSVAGESNNIPSLMVKQGDMIMLLNNCNGSSFRDSTHLRFAIQYENGGVEKINALTPSHSLISTQGTDNFYFYTAVCFNAKYDGEGCHDFGNVTESELPWEANGRGAGWHAFVTIVNGVYAQPQSPSDTQKEAGSYHPTYFQTHMLKGQDTAFAFKAQSDCLAVISRAWICKNMTNNPKSSDGINVAFVYKSVDNGKATYKSLFTKAWERINVSSTKPIIQEFFDFPAVEMKAGDEIMIIFDNYNTTPYDGTNAYMEITVQDKETGKFSFHSFQKDITCYVDGSEPNLGPWEFKVLKLSYDFSSTIIADVSDKEYDVFDDFYTEKITYFSLEGKYQSITDPDLLITSKNSVVTVSPGETNAVAIAYTVSKSGRVVLGKESYIILQNDGTSNGIRIRIMKNNEIIYPSENGWKYYLDDTKHTIGDCPVISVEEGDILYFIIDSFGDTTSDTVALDVIWHFAKDGEDYTESYVLSEDYSETQGADNWEYLEMSMGSDKYSGIISVEKANFWDSYGMIILIATASVVFVASASVTIVIIKKSRGKRK